MNDEVIKVKVRKGFLNGEEFVDNGDEIAVSRTRARELALNGLVELPDGESPKKDGAKPMKLSGDDDTGKKAAASDGEGGEKKAAEPSNKKRKDPQNKAK
jgi:hypothetical protein